MKYNLLLVFVLSLFLTKSFSQAETLLASDFGINISYQLVLEKEGKKKNTYLLIINAENVSETSLFYSVQLHKNDKKEWILPVVPKEKSFTRVKITNANTFFGSSKLLFGDKTKHELKDNQSLLELKKGKVYTEKMRFKIKSDIQPKITNTFLRSLKKIENFEFKLGATVLDGNYVSNCSDDTINLEFHQSKKREDNTITEVMNGEKYIWIRFNRTTFIRKDNPDYWLTYNEKQKTFSFSTPEGTTCNWEKESNNSIDQSFVKPR